MLSLERCKIVQILISKMLQNAYVLQMLVWIQPRTSPPKICRNSFGKMLNLAKSASEVAIEEDAGEADDAGGPPRGPTWRAVTDDIVVRESAGLSSLLARARKSR